MVEFRISSAQEVNYLEIITKKMTEQTQEKQPAVGRLMLKLVGQPNLLFAGVLVVNYDGCLDGGNCIIKQAPADKKIDASGVIVTPGYPRDDRENSLSGYIQLIRNTDASKKYNMLAYIKLTFTPGADGKDNWITTHKSFLYRVGDNPLYEGDVLTFNNEQTNTPELHHTPNLW